MPSRPNTWPAPSRPPVRPPDQRGHPGARATLFGMIQLRGPHTLRGVCGRNREELFTADGFHPTGDLGHLDDEGFMFYHGRSDDMFKVSGTVYPSEVERALRTMEGVNGAFVTNVRSDRGDRVWPTVWLLLASDDDVLRGSPGRSTSGGYPNCSPKHRHWG
jgi:acyl-coenzyme A synthetase/AMP-(fatty) acid ligase